MMVAKTMEDHRKTMDSHGLGKLDEYKPPTSAKNVQILRDKYAVLSHNFFFQNLKDEEGTLQ